MCAAVNGKVNAVRTLLRGGARRDITNNVCYFHYLISINCTVCDHVSLSQQNECFYYVFSLVPVSLWSFGGIV